MVVTPLHLQVEGGTGGLCERRQGVFDELQTIALLVQSAGPTLTPANEDMDNATADNVEQLRAVGERMIAENDAGLDAIAMRLLRDAAEPGAPATSTRRVPSVRLAGTPVVL